MPILASSPFDPNERLQNTPVGWRHPVIAFVPGSILSNCPMPCLQEVSIAAGDRRPWPPMLRTVINTFTASKTRMHRPTLPYRPPSSDTSGVRQPRSLALTRLLGDRESRAAIGIAVESPGRIPIGSFCVRRNGHDRIPGTSCDKRGVMPAYFGKTRRRLVAVDFFCGAGGLSYGMQEAGIRIAAGLDIDPQL